MILPHPESNLKLNLMVLGAGIINIMNSGKLKNNYVLVEILLEKFLSKDKKRSPTLFLYALTFLYIIGSIERKGYQVKLVGKNKGNTSQRNSLDSDAY